MTLSLSDSKDGNSGTGSLDRRGLGKRKDKCSSDHGMINTKQAHGNK